MRSIFTANASRGLSLMSQLTIFSGPSGRPWRPITGGCRRVVPSGRDTWRRACGPITIIPSGRSPMSSVTWQLMLLTCMRPCRRQTWCCLKVISTTESWRGTGSGITQWASMLRYEVLDLPHCAAWGLSRPTFRSVCSRGKGRSLAPKIQTGWPAANTQSFSSTARSQNRKTDLWISLGRRGEHYSKKELPLSHKTTKLHEVVKWCLCSSSSVSTSSCLIQKYLIVIFTTYLYHVILKMLALLDLNLPPWFEHNCLQW